MKYLILAFCIVALQGCSTTSGLAPKTTHSGFDDARVVKIPPHGTACKTSRCLVVGAEWHESSKDMVFFKAGVTQSTVGITSIELNIDGKKSYSRTNKLTDFSNSGGIRYSMNSIRLPINTIDSILNSKKTWVRIGTTKGTIENFIIDGGEDSKAYHALKRFRASIKA